MASADDRLLAMVQRKLIAAAGGVHEANPVAGLSPESKHLYRCQDPNQTDALTLRAALALARHAGDASLFLSLAQAVDPEAAEAVELKDAAVGATLAVGSVLQEVREATADGVVTPLERERIRKKVDDAHGALRLVGAATDGGGDAA